MESKRVISTKKTIALIAHDHKKGDLIAWVKENKAALANHILFATGTTGKLIEAEIKQPVNRMLSGPLGGDQEIGALIATGKIDLMIFFSDPMEMQPHDSDVRALVRLGTAWNIPMALNRASADFLVSSPYMSGDYEIEIPDYSSYFNRKIKEN